MDNDAKIQALTAELRRMVPGTSGEDVATRLVVAEGVVVAVMADLVVNYGLEPAEILDTVLGQIREMLESSVEAHSLN